MADAPLPWLLSCPWCDYAITVNARGGRGDDPGAGVEAARYMTHHAEGDHGRTWQEFLEEAS